MEQISNLDAADRHDQIRTDLEINTSKPSAYYLAQCRELHDGLVNGPMVCVGWSSVASKVEIVSSRP